MSIKSLGPNVISFKVVKQAGAELGQAQLKLRLDINLDFYLVELVWWALYFKFD